MSEVTAEMIERGRGADPEAAAARRRQAAKLRNVRERLTSGGALPSAFEMELMRLFAHSRKSATPVVAVMVMAVGGAASVWVPWLYVSLWVSLLFVSLALCFWFSATYLESPASETGAAVWRRKFALSETIQGVVWAMIVALLLPVQEPGARTFVLFVLLLVAAMTAMISATIPIAVYCGLMPITIALIAYAAPTGGYDMIMLTVLAVAAQLYFVVLANRLYSTSVEGLSFRQEKDALIAELEQAKANSDEARRRAEDANLAKSRFLATMSHELRTPLNAILGFSEVMKNELFGPHAVPAYREYAADIHGSGQHLLMLINEILDLSRVEAGRYELKEETINLAFLVDECQHLLAMRAKKKGITVTLAAAPDLPRVWADERAIRQVTLNLLSNAIKFTPQGGSVTIKIGWTGSGGQYVSIRDTGPGIPEAEIPIVMSSFGRGSMALKQAEEGTGLGLPIVKGLIELHGGAFLLKSKIREGTEATFVMPPERVMDALPQIRIEEPPPNGRRAA
ncbi:MAG: sensor histidine kinase [Methylobacteriaceae bacterium]|nr:sensor histidine kinase [Methylobacteriaceae bacterium]